MALKFHQNKKRQKILYFCFLFLLGSFYPRIAAAIPQMGASLYIAPLSENPRAGSNFTATLKVDSLSEPINAVRAGLVFNKERLEVISVSKIGSILNLWIEEPRFSNMDGMLKFQGGLPRPGFVGNGGTVLHIIFRAKSSGPTSFVWKEGEVLASDGKGTNVLTNLQNLDFFIEEPITSFTNPWATRLITLNFILIAIIFLAGLFFGGRMLLRYHDKHYHRRGY